MVGHLKSLCPVFFVIEKETPLTPSSAFFCRGYVEREDQLIPGEMCFSVVNPDGCKKKVTVCVPDRSLFKFPNETNDRKIVLDRLLRTQIFELQPNCEDFLETQVPFEVSENPEKELSCIQGSVTLEYTDFVDDPGYKAAIDESQWLEFLTGKSVAKEFIDKVKGNKFEVGDFIPVYVECGSSQIFSIVKLMRKIKDDCFLVEVWLKSIKLEDVSKKTFLLSRKFSAEQLNQSTGKMNFVTYEAIFGSLEVS